MRLKDDLGGFYFINEDSLQIKNGDFIFLVGEIFFSSYGNGFLWLCGFLYSLFSCVFSLWVRVKNPRGR